MDERRLELKVGAFALVAIALVVGLVLVLGGFSSGKRFRFHADFAYAGGLPAGAAVKIAGVKVGRVRQVEFRPDVREDGRAVPVRLHVDIDQNAARALRADAVATVSQEGALGESHLEVLPGTSLQPLEPNAVIRGIDPPRLDVVLSRLHSLLENAAEDDAFRSFLVEVSHLARSARIALEENEEEVGGVLEGVTGMIVDGRNTLADARVIVRSVAELLSDPALRQTLGDVAAVAQLAREELPEIAESTQTLLARVDNLTEPLSVEDVERLRATLRTVERLSKSADALLAGIEEGEGTVGQLVKDPQVYKDLRALLADLKAHPWKLVWKR